MASATKGYKIPADLNTGYGDMEIALSPSASTGAKPLPVKVIGFYLGSAFLCMYICMKSFVARGGPLLIALFIAFWAGFTVLLASFDKTKQMKCQLVMPLLNYLQPSSRRVLTRKNSAAAPFYGIVGIRRAPSERGLVEYDDGTFGYWYRVVGSASVLLFDRDRDAIINRVDLFYHKIEPSVECIFMTCKEPQKVYRQIASLKRRHDALTTPDPDLKALANEQFKVLRDDVGKHRKSIHQYMVLKADNAEALQSAKNVLQSEVENSSLMIKQCTPMYEKDIYEVLAGIYKGEVVVS